MGFRNCAADHPEEDQAEQSCVWSSSVGTGCHIAVLLRKFVESSIDAEQPKSAGGAVAKWNKSEVSVANFPTVPSSCEARTLEFLRKY